MEKNQYFRKFNLLSLLHLIRLQVRPFIIILFTSILIFYTLSEIYISNLHKNEKHMEEVSTIIQVQPSLKIASFRDFQNNSILTFSTIPLDPDTILDPRFVEKALAALKIDVDGQIQLKQIIDSIEISQNKDFFEIRVRSSQTGFAKSLSVALAEELIDSVNGQTVEAPVEMKWPAQTDNAVHRGSARDDIESYTVIENFLPGHAQIINQTFGDPYITQANSRMPAPLDAPLLRILLQLCLSILAGLLLSVTFVLLYFMRSDSILDEISLSENVQMKDVEMISLPYCYNNKPSSVNKKWEESIPSFIRNKFEYLASEILYHKGISQKKSFLFASYAHLAGKSLIIHILGYILSNLGKHVLIVSYGNTKEMPVDSNFEGSLNKQSISSKLDFTTFVFPPEQGVNSRIGYFTDTLIQFEREYDVILIEVDCSVTDDFLLSPLREKISIIAVARVGITKIRQLNYLVKKFEGKGGQISLVLLNGMIPDLLTDRHQKELVKHEIVSYPDENTEEYCIWMKKTSRIGIKLYKDLFVHDLQK